MLCRDGFISLGSQTVRIAVVFCRAFASERSCVLSNITKLYTIAKLTDLEMLTPVCTLVHGPLPPRACVGRDWCTGMVTPMV